MEISDEKLRQIVREALRELGAEAAPELVHKVVHEVIRRLQQKEAPAQPVVGKSHSSSAPGY